MKIALIQLTSKLDYNENLKKIKTFLEVAKKKGATVAFLPECFYSFSDGKSPTPFLVEDQNEHYENIRSLAKDSEINIVAGSAAALVDGKIVNRVYNFDKEGNPLPIYDKRKLFSCDINRNGVQKKIDEGDIYNPGHSAQVIEVDGIKIGLGVCFDIRFSELSLEYQKLGVDILTFSAAFTIPTGKAHWHLLNRARAVESQCFVVSPAQWGEHNDTMRTYGHSLVVDPWGDILCDLEEGESVEVVELDKSRIKEVRESVIMKR